MPRMPDGCARTDDDLYEIIQIGESQIVQSYVVNTSSDGDGDSFW